VARIFGLSLGFGMAFFQEYLDNTLKTPEDVQKYLQLPTLGVIPAANLAAKRIGYGYGGKPRKALAAESTSGNSSVQLVGTNGNSAIAEAYRSLRTSVLLSSSGQPPRVILVTSGHPGEGKTTTAVNLAIAMVQLGKRVLIVDSDMRRPRVGTLLKLAPTTAGLSTYLTGQYTFDDVIQSTSIPDLFAVTCGPIPPNPAELLSSSQMNQFIAEAPTKFDYVIFDSPPVLHVADSRILGAQVEAAVLVTHGNVTPRESVQHAKAQLQRVNTNVIGVLLNNVDFNASGYNHYYRYYGGDGYGYESHEHGTNSAGA
jgi:capsular exopolysaccharide synthesis family protein